MLPKRIVPLYLFRFIFLGPLHDPVEEQPSMGPSS